MRTALEAAPPGHHSWRQPELPSMCLIFNSMGRRFYGLRAVGK